MVPDHNIEKADSKKIYSGHKTKGGNNEAIILTVVAKSDLHKKILKAYVNKSPSQFTMTWRKMAFTGKGRPLVNMNLLEEMIDFVSKTKGAIGYSSSEVPSDGVLIIQNK